MARLTFQGLDAVMDELTRRENGASEVIGQMLEAGAAEMVQAWKDAAPVRTGGLQKSIKASKITKDADGGNAVISPKGTNKYGYRYGEIAFILHYGTSRINASRWVDAAEADGEPKVEAAMRAIWDAQK